MAGENIVSIIVKAVNETKGGFGEAKADSAAAGAGMDELAAAQDRVALSEGKLREAQIQQMDAQLRLEELQQSGTAGADELAAAQDKVTSATLRSADAQIRLGAADADLAAKEALAGDGAAVQAEKTGLAGRMAGAGAAGFAKFGLIGSAALAGVGYESVKMAMSFQKSMELLVTQAGVPAKEMGALKSGVLSLAGAVGFSPDSLSTSLFHVASNMASLGATAPQMLNLVKTAAEGAKVGNADLEDVTNALTAAVASGIPGVQSYTQAMGALNAIVGAGDMKMQDLADAMGTGVMAVVKGYGLSLKDVGAALDVFGDNNIRGAHAATDLRMAVMALSVPAATGKAALQGMGLSMSSLASTMRQGGLLPALQQLQAHMKAAGITAAEQGQVITEIFGKKAGVGLSVLMDQMDRLKSKYPAITEGANKFGAAWGNTQKTLSQQWDQLRAAFDALMVSIGSKLIPVLSAVAGFLVKNRGIITALAPAVLAVVAAFTALKVVMMAINVVSDMNPWALAIMAVIAVTVLLVEHWKTVETVAKDVFHAVTSAVSTAFDWIKGHWPLLLAILTGPIGLSTLFIIDHWHQILSGAKSMLDNVVGFFRSLPGRIASALGDVGHMLWNQGVAIVMGLVHGMDSMVGAARHEAAHLADNIVGFFGLSPAREGPLSAGGAPFIRGQHLVQDIAAGMLSARGGLAQTAHRIATTATPQPGTAGGYAAAGPGGAAGITIQFQAGAGGSGLDQLFMTWLKNSVRASGGDPRIFNRKVAFQ